jgi:formamidopyrimidine-DNA glycosylase
MPELPEVETTLRAIQKFKNSTIKDVKIHNRSLRWKVEKNFETSTINQTIKKPRQASKIYNHYFEKYKYNPSSWNVRKLKDSKKK